MKEVVLTIEFVGVAGSPTAYSARFELRTPGSQAMELLTDGSAHPFVLSRDSLELESLPDDDYTRRLSEAVFEPAEYANALTRARDAARLQDAPLRVRISLAPSAAALYGVRWEMLGDPGRNLAPFAIGQRTSLARWVRPRDLAARPRRHRHGLRSVMLVANPDMLRDSSGLPHSLSLAGIPVEAFTDAANAQLGETRLRVLDGERADLESLTHELEDGCDILVLACHGAFVQDRSRIYLEKRDKEAQLVEGRTLAQRIGELREHPPRLAVLASCHSLRDSDEVPGAGASFFASLAYQVAMVGVPAVLAMQGPVSPETAHVFLDAFLRSVLKGNNIEAAAAEARMRIIDREDWWMPALLLGIDDGVLWSEAKAAPELFWNELVKKIGKGECTPIIGSDLLEPLSNRRFSQYLARHLRTPLREQGLPRIAQQLKVEKGPDRPGNELENFYRFEVAGPAIRAGAAEPLPELLSRWAQRNLGAPVFNPYRELAELGVFPAFVTTCPDSLLAEALVAASLSPQVLVCPWKGRTEDTQALPTSVTASIESPLVFHLFGHMSDPQSVVLTEDDFFDHLIWLAVNNNLLPSELINRVSSNSLLFLGFHLEDWEFRILLRSIVKLPGSLMLSQSTHVAVQLDPAELTSQDLIDAEQALEDFFSKTDIRLEIYWGTVEDFLRGLRRHVRPERKLAGVLR
jgi:hypothetical protein